MYPTEKEFTQKVHSCLVERSQAGLAVYGM